MHQPARLHLYQAEDAKRTRSRDGNEAAVDPVVELPEQRREDGERADERDGDDDHRPDADRREDLRAGEEHPGHRDQNGEAGDEHCLAGRGGCAVESVAAVPGLALLSLALDIEERVVDADRHSDQEHHGVRRVRCVHDVARELREPDRAEHGREREQHRDACGDERAEGEEKDQERDRDGELLRFLEVLADRVV